MTVMRSATCPLLTKGCWVVQLQFAQMYENWRIGVMFLLLMSLGSHFKNPTDVWECEDVQGSTLLLATFIQGPLSEFSLRWCGCHKLGSPYIVAYLKQGDSNSRNMWTTSLWDM